VLLLTLIIVLAFYLRFIGTTTYGLPTTTGTLATYHPDESIHMYSMEKMNPSKLNFFPGDALYWGSFQIYMQAALSKVFSSLGFIKLGDRKFLTSNLHEVDKLYIVGRMTSVVFGTMSIILIFLMGKQLYGIKGGLLAALLLAVTPSAVVSSFYAKPDSVMLFWGMLCCYFVILLYKTGESKYYYYSGIAVGLSFVSKYSGIIFLLFLLIVHLEMCLKQRDILYNFKYLVFCGLLSLAAFLVVNPYCIIEHQFFLSRFLCVASKASMNYTNIFHEYKFFLFVMLPLLAGWGIYITALPGMIFYVFELEPLETAMLIFFVIFAVRLGPPSNAIYLYSLHLIPFMILFSTKFILKISRFRAGSILAAAAVLFLFIQTGSIKLQYVIKGTRESASDWISSNIPKTKTIGMTKNDWWTVPVLKKYNPEYNIITGGTPQDPLDKSVEGIIDRSKETDFLIVTNYEMFFIRNDKPLLDRFNKDISSHFVEIKTFGSPITFLGHRLYSKASEAYINPNPYISIYKKI
jgi:asparagine N-glycosylation enzyme membrane subunit Stt3